MITLHGPWQGIRSGSNSPLWTARLYGPLTWLSTIMASVVL